MMLTDIEKQLRAQCLNEAIRSAPPGLNPNDIVTAAATFLAFVEGKKPDAKQKTSRRAK